MTRDTNVTDSGFATLSVRELDAIRRSKRGLVLVDHNARDSLRPSILHSASCAWLGSVNGVTPIRQSDDVRDVLRWLRSNRGDEGDGWKRCPGCKAQVANEPVRTLPRYEVGELLTVSGVHRSIGRVDSETGKTVSVTMFEGPAGRPRTTEAHLADVARFAPAPKDFAWVDRDGEWQRVSIVSADGAEALVQSGAHGHVVSTSSLRFREFVPLADPLGHLMAGLAGSMRGAFIRRRFNDAYFALSAPAQGLTAVLSAGVSLFPHQIGVVRRVLADPVQRYLLADEVGLGKTIEAGLIIRQRLIDAPRSVVVVIVPNSLVPQWEDELHDRLGLQRFRRGGIEVVAHEDPGSWRRASTPDLVVIDEAHHVAGGWSSPIAEHSARFDAAKKVTHEAARVLLLSATPVLHRERDLLGMLHLLDPDTFPLDDLDGFTERIRSREEIGRSFLGLAPGTPGFLLAHPLAELRQRFAADSRLVALIDAVEPDAPDETREATLTDVRLHVSETYRLHSRLLRNRRAVITEGNYTVRGRGGHQRFRDYDPRRPTIERWLDDWRGALLEQAADTTDEWRGVHAEVFWCFVQAASGDLDCLRHLALYRKTLRLRHLEASGIDLAARGALKSVKLEGRARAVLDRALAILGPEPEEDELRRSKQALAKACHAAIGDAPAVVFTSAESTAEVLATFLEDTLQTSVRAVGKSLEMADRRAAVHAFRDGAVRVLVCDAASEEGLNLQQADVIVHLDTPRAASRVEQRIGRADRHGGAGAPVLSQVLVGESDGYASTWTTALADVFDVFDRSAASTLFAVEAVQREQQLAWFLDGLPELESLDVDEMRRRVEEEQSRIDRVDSLDALARQDSDDTQLVERIEAVEQTQAAHFGDVFSAYAELTTDALGYSSVAVGADVRASSVVRITGALRGRSALVGTPLFSTSDRLVAACQPGVGLIRPGDALVEAIREQLDWDEQTQTFAAWARDSEGLQLLAVQTAMIVHADPVPGLRLWREREAQSRRQGAVRTEADAPLVLAGIQRRLDAMLPPQHVVIWYSADGAPIEDDEFVADLDSRLRDPDTVERWGIDAVVESGASAGFASGGRLLAEVREAAAGHALERAAMLVNPVQAAAEARAVWSSRTRLMRLRAERAGDAAAMREALAEEQLNDALLEAVGMPIATWDSAGVLVIEPA